MCYITVLHNTNTIFFSKTLNLYFLFLQAVQKNKNDKKEIVWLSFQFILSSSHKRTEMNYSIYSGLLLWKMEKDMINPIWVAIGHFADLASVKPADIWAKNCSWSLLMNGEAKSFIANGLSATWADTII